ncbi:hypothetical protein NM688_g2841 [Phlebia brevispora]|uniref:Uncharacterized protein n=1 Tax=Phlebia brevispora TaxID=194682 RepID=A0ACC1T7U7_9APHY|nr:hypothetical protein NM688_g2841 [Phlebia brevispora]
MYEKRNQDFHDISRRLVFDSGIPEHDLSYTPGAEYAIPNVPLNIFQSDALFWMGDFPTATLDLNYRLNLTDADVRSLMSEGAEENIPLMLEFDQLTLAARAQKAFEHFVEFPITHLPSYRFNSAALSDGLGYDLKRKPAWTDRILYMSTPASSALQTAYTSHPEISMSDHKPVSADFEIRIPTVDSDELEAMVHNLWKEVSNSEESEEHPNLNVEIPIVDFGKIGYKDPQSRTVHVSNTGNIASAFRFIPLAPGAPIHPDWLQIEPKAGLLLPGEHADIVFSAEVNAASAWQLNLDDGLLEVTLILHTALGKDHFLTVTAQYVRMPGPVRKLDNQELLPEEDAASAPKEIMRLINWLMAEATSVDSLFVSPGDPKSIATIRECLDNGSEFPVPSVATHDIFSLSVAQALLELLDSLPEPVVPCAVHAACMRVSNRDEAFELLNQFPSASVNVWISVTSFLHFISQQGTMEKKAERLAAIFAPVLLRDDFDAAPVSPVGKRRFVLFFIAQKITTATYAICTGAEEMLQY